ncbi:MAG: amidohydrolase family protein [Thermodesulfobacteriota bacterium]
MTLIDFHVHIGTRQNWTPSVMSYFDRMNPRYTREMAEEITTQQVIDYLDEEHVDRAVVLAEYAPKTTGVVTNEFIVDFCKGTDRLIPFGCVCLYEGPDPVVQAERCLKGWGCRGIKFLPTYAHFFPDNPRLLPVYELAQDLDFPVMFHTGTSIFKGSRIKYGNPLLLDDIAEDFPRLVIVMSHGGRPFWYSEAEWLLRRHPNMHIDLAGIPPKQLPQIFPHLEQLSDRFVFGTDWPGIQSIAAQADQIRNLPFHPDTIEALLWRNAARLLKLDAGAL